MKRSLFSLGLACVAVAAALPASAQIDTNTLPNTNHGPFNLAEAYPCTALPYTSGSEAQSITTLQVFNGGGVPFAGTCANPANATPGPIPGAAPGVLCLRRPFDTNTGLPTSTSLDVNCFVTIPSGQTGPCFVQAFRLFKMVPGSFKCPDVYGLPHFVKDSNGNLVLSPYVYAQFGSSVRTWWSLNFTQPGTVFLLQVVSVCQVPRPVLTQQVPDPDHPGQTKTVQVLDPNTGQPVLVPGSVPSSAIHVDSWRWRVVADGDTLLNVINLMHEGAVSTLEVPCILGEDMYDALIKAVGTPPTATSTGSGLRGAIGEPTNVTVDTNTSVPNQTRLNDIGNAIFNMEALIVANCLFVEVLNPLVAFPGPAQFGAPNIQPPGNLAQTVTFGTQGSAVAGIIDTVEHPCCCKLLVDLEWISIRQGLVGQSPTLPTF